MPRNGQLAQSIIGSVGGRAATLIAPFLVMPAMLDHVGPRDFGVWMTAIAITNVTQFADLGIGNGLLTRLSATFANNDREAARRDIASGYAVLSSVSIPMIIVGLLLMTTDVVDISPIYGATVAAFAVSIPASVIQRVLYASQQVVRANIWQAFAAALSVAVAYAAIAADWSAAAIVLVYGLVPPMIMLLAAIATFIRRRDIVPRFVDISGSAARSLMGLGSRFLILAILTAMAMSADILMVAVRLGDAAVTDYAVPARIGSLLGLVVGTVMMPLWSTYGEAIARNEHDWVWTNACRMAAIGSGAVIACGGFLTIFIDPILMMWMGRKFAEAEWIIGGLALFSLITAMTAPFNMVLNATGKVSPQVLVWSMFLASTLAAKWIILPATGIWVLPLIDTLLYGTIVSPMMLLVAKRIAAKRHFPEVN